MFELVKIRNNTFMMSVHVTDIGIYRFGKRSAVLIDSGRGREEEFISFLKENDIVPAAVIQTHLHIDHVACNQLLRKEYQCDIYASADEIIHENEGGYIAGRDALINPDNGILDISGNRFEIISLPGHSCGHQGVVTPDGVCFLGDAMMSRDILKYTKMPYHYNIEQAIESMEKIKTLDYPEFVLSHRGILDRNETIVAADANLKRERQFRKTVESLCGKRISNGKLTTMFMKEIGITEDKADIAWVWDTALDRVETYRR